MDLLPLAATAAAHPSGNTWWFVLGAFVAGWVCCVLFWPPIVAWWYHVTAVTKLGLERVIYGAGLLAIVGGLIWLASRSW